ncbi:shikimate dehydrogenase [Sneathiella sp. P13V-1]|uniref:shikimate dehydrogenase n=1 Tax=Sneathiella sp. P13V-1 TaxID=2697366 RepID=UPI00187B385A|nr:shikimate dehydrogenase [Sneathiella sp. P13V-1]MBE7636070.1 shikimate dehydrogenase [Sneathiella sp. P13V-1]
MIKAAGVMGFPISHSLSPRLHGYWIKKYGLEATYVAWEVPPERLAAKLKNLPDLLGENGELFRGTNLTIPLKEKALEIVDIVEEDARAIGAINTVVVEGDGLLIGRNTDGIGFIDSLAEKIDVADFKGKTALVLGAGGAAKAIVFALIKMGFAKILITNRTRTRAEELADHLTDGTEVLDWDERESVLSQVSLVVNTTSLGMKGQPALEMSLQGLKAGAVVTDIVYTPLKTGLLLEAEKNGFVAVDGLGMLLHQAKAGFEAWFGVRPEVDADLREFVLQGLADK